MNDDKRKRARNLLNLYYGGVMMDSKNIRIKKKTVTATTSNSGAFDAGLDIDTQYILAARCTSTTNRFAFHRGDGYMTAFYISNDVMTVLKNTSVTFDIYYFDA